MRRIVAVLLTILILILSVPYFVFASGETAVNLDEDINNCMFVVTWENNVDAQIELVDPQGMTHNKQSLGDRYISQSKSVSIFLPKAVKGKWIVKAVGEGLSAVSVDVSEVVELPEIKSFEAVPVGSSEDEFTFKWTTESCSNMDVEIYADLDKQGFNGERIYSGYAYEDCEKGEVNVKLEKISFGSYYFYLKINSDGITDYMYFDKSFQVSPQGLPEELSNVRAVIKDKDVYISWDADKSSDIWGYTVLVFEKENGELIYKDTTAETEYIVYPVTDSSIFDIAVAAINYNEQWGRYKKIGVDLKTVEAMKLDAVFPEGDIINQSRLRLDIGIDKGNTAGVLVNDEELADNINESGSCLLDLQEGRNDIDVFVRDGKGNERHATKTLYVDIYPPQLNVYGNYDGMKTKLSGVKIAGDVENGAVLIANGREITVEDGKFGFEHPLKRGRNKLVLTAEDKAGNKSEYLAVIEREFDAAFIYLAVFLIILAAAIALMVFMYMSKKKQKRSE